MHQTSTGTKKTQKKTKNQATTQKWTHSSWNFYFFVFLVPVQVWCIQWFVFLFFLVPVPVWCIYWFVCFFDACAGFGDSRLCMFGSWPYFKLMFQRSKHTVIFEQLCHHTGCLTLIFNSLTHVFVSQAFSLSLSNY